MRVAAEGLSVQLRASAGIPVEGLVTVAGCNPLELINYLTLITGR